MPIIQTTAPKYKKSKDIKREWTNFRKGLNLLLRDTELGNDEMSQADNIVLEGSGVPKGRWGTAKYFTANITGTLKGLGTYTVPSSDTYEVLALTDQGYLCKRKGTGSDIITGQSWPSGSKVEMVQLSGETYLASKDVSFTKYDGSNLIPFATIPKPTGLSATNYSGATGPNRISYKIVAASPNGGTTDASDNYVLDQVPFDLATTQIRLQWTGSSASTISGYDIYRGTEGDEAFLAGVGADVTEYVDDGSPTASLILSPSTNTTGGYKSAIIAKYKDRLLLVPDEDKTKLVISARYPYHTNFSISWGGGFIYVDPDGGEDITAINVQPISDRIVVYKNHASYLVELSSVNVGNYVLLDPQYQPISTSVGCSSQETLAVVENDTFYFGRDGIYVTGYEPNFLNIIRTNEVSARIRPYLDQLNDDDYKNACAAYFDNKYIISIPTRREMIVYDRERGCFAGIWKLPFGISFMRKIYEDNGTEKWILGSYESNQVYSFEKSVNNDDGQTITKTIRTNREDFGDWTLLSLIKYFYILFRDITGETNVNIILEDRDGNRSTAKTFNISGSEVAGLAGYGDSMYGVWPYGMANNDYSTSTNEITRWGTLFKQARLVQIEVTSSANNSNFELLAIKLTANKQAEGSLSASQRV